MGDDTSTPFGSSSDVSLSTFTDAVENWVLVGQPALNGMLNALHESGLELDPMIETFVFSIVGGYTFNFSQGMLDGMSLSDSHAHSVSLMMKNPKISNLTESMLQNVVADKIDKVVN